MKSLRKFVVFVSFSTFALAAVANPSLRPAGANESPRNQAASKRATSHLLITDATGGNRGGYTCLVESGESQEAVTKFLAQSPAAACAGVSGKFVKVAPGAGPATEIYR